MINLYKQATAVATTLLLSLFLLPSCSNDENGGMPDGKLYTVTLSLSPSTSSRPAYTKADNPPYYEEDADYEREIKECWVAIFDSEDKWVKTLSTNDFKETTNVNDSEREATVELTAGTYSFYAFANLDGLKATDATELKGLLEQGTGTPDIFEKKTVSLLSKESFKIGGTAIPMSSYKKEFIVQDIETDQEVVLELFRMLGKVEISITNLTGKALTLNELTMGMFREGPIHLIPYASGNINLGNLTVDNVNSFFPLFDLVDANATIGSYKQVIIANGSLTTEIADNETKDFPFYAFETGAIQTEEGIETSLPLSVGIHIKDREASEEKTSFEFMRRNDWLQIPIRITNIETTLSIWNMRMPIGGLPNIFVYGEGTGIQVGVDAVNKIDHGYAGPVKVEFELGGIDAGEGISASNWEIVYEPTGGNASEKPWSTAVLINNDAGLIIDKETGLPTTSTEIKLQASDDPDNPGEKSKTKGSFEVWVQELSESDGSYATIKLTLVAKYGDGPDQKIEIPYTIQLQTKPSSTEGGN